MQVTLPWKTLDGPAVTPSFVFVTVKGKPLNRNRFNEKVWQRALRAAGGPASRENGMHALRNFYASVLLDAGESTRR
ncbi:hypothetical protein [Streptomyces rubiginosohelvolus]|uniref:hypothetical protein n=1 Tax=Streptomyces rubiginosohelvolus TaxID=67362 RepID=UPI003829CC81